MHSRNAACAEALDTLHKTLRRMSNYQIKYALLRCSTTMSILEQLLETCRHGAELLHTARVYANAVQHLLRTSPPRRMAPKTVMAHQARQYIRLTSLRHCSAFQSVYDCIRRLPMHSLPHSTKMLMQRDFFATMQPTLEYTLQSRKAS
jgi:hypothetical protein